MRFIQYPETNSSSSQMDSSSNHKFNLLKPQQYDMRGPCSQDILNNIVNYIFRWYVIGKFREFAIEGCFRITA